MKKLFFLICLSLMVGTINVSAQKSKKKLTQKESADSVLKAKRTQEIKDSLNAIMAKAKAGDDSAMNEVGTWYYTGKHVKQDYSTAFDWWKKSALKKNVRAIANLGLCYQLGHGVKKDSVDAIRLYKKSIRDGNELLLKQRMEIVDKSAFDAMLVGNCYETANGVKKDLAKAAEYYSKAAAKGSVDGMRMGGMCFLNSKQNVKAYQLFKKGSDKGDVTSSFWYGKMLLGNMGVAADKKTAVIALLKAAEVDMPAAQNAMGELYAQGNGVVKNEQTAFGWYKKAAQNDFSKAMWNLAECYKDGIGVKRDLSLALSWMAEVAPLGYTRAFKSLVHKADSIGNVPFAFYVHGMKNYMIDEDLSKANANFKKLAKTKCEEGTIMQAVILASKKNPKPNAKKAAQSLAKLSDTNAEAAFYLATLYESGNGVEKDMAKAIELYKSAADKDYGKAQCYLADIYYEGRGTDKNVAKAVELYKLAQANHELSENGIKRLADCIENGVGGLTPDKKAADKLRKTKYTNKVYQLLKTIN